MARKRSIKEVKKEPDNLRDNFSVYYSRLTNSLDSEPTLKPYVTKRMTELGNSVEICPECGGVIFRCFPDGSGKCGDCGTIFPSLGD